MIKRGRIKIFLFQKLMYNPIEIHDEETGISEKTLRQSLGLLSDTV